jgi:hypothetical protein
VARLRARSALHGIRSRTFVALWIVRNFSLTTTELPCYNKSTAKGCKNTSRHAKPTAPESWQALGFVGVLLPVKIVTDEICSDLFLCDFLPPSPYQPAPKSAAVFGGCVLAPKFPHSPRPRPEAREHGSRLQFR